MRPRLTRLPLGLLALGLIAGLVLAAPAGAAPSSKPKEIVVVGSKVKEILSDGAELTLHLAAEFSRYDDGATSATGRFVFSDPAHGRELHGHVSGGDFIFGTEPPVIELTVVEIRPDGGRGATHTVRLSPGPDVACRQITPTRETLAARWACAGDLQIEIDGARVDQGHAHGHLDFLKKVGDPAT